MGLGLKELEDAVYDCLDDSGGSRLRRDDAQTLRTRVDEGRATERIVEILDHLSEEITSENDRRRITFSLVQLLEGHRMSDEEERLPKTLMSAIKEARQGGALDEDLVETALDAIRSAPPSAFDGAAVSKDDAKLFLKDLQDKLDGTEESQQAAMNAVSSIAETVKNA